MAHGDPVRPDGRKRLFQKAISGKSACVFNGASTIASERPHVCPGDFNPQPEAGCHLATEDFVGIRGLAAKPVVEVSQTDE